MRTIIVLACVGAIAGCGAKTQDGQKRFLIIFSQCNNAEPYRAAQNALLEQLCAKYDDIELVIKDGQQDNSKQIAQIETAIRQKPDILIVAPNERAPLTKIMGSAMEAGIPTICLERDIKEPNYTTYIKCDNYKIGQMAGEYVVERLKEKYGQPKGDIVEIRGLLGVEGEINRYQGAHDVWDKYPDIKVIHEGMASWLQSDGRARMTEMLNANPSIDVVYGHNDPMAVGAYLAAKEKGREKEMIFVGVDGLGGEAGGIKKVMDGILDVTFYYPLCVDKAVELANRMLREPGFVPDKEYVMESAIITKENAQEMHERFTF